MLGARGLDRGQHVGQRVGIVHRQLAFLRARRGLVRDAVDVAARALVDGQAVEAERIEPRRDLAILAAAPPGLVEQHDERRLRILVRCVEVRRDGQAVGRGEFELFDLGRRARGAGRREEREQRGEDVHMETLGRRGQTGGGRATRQGTPAARRGASLRARSHGNLESRAIPGCTYRIARQRRTHFETTMLTLPSTSAAIPFALLALCAHAPEPAARVVPASAPARMEGTLESVRYVLTVPDPADVEDASAPSVHVRVELAGLVSDAEALELAMPQGFAFVRLPEPLLETEPRAERSGEAIALERPAPYAWRLPLGDVRDDGGTVAITHSVPLTHRADPRIADRDDYEYPYLAADHGMLYTPVFFLFPQDVDVAAWRVELDLPDGWPAYTTWSPAAEAADDTLCFAPERAPLDDLVAIGAWEVRETEVGDLTAILAVAPGQGTLLADVAPIVDATVRAEVEIFGRTPRARYAFLFGLSEQPFFAGSTKSSSMTLAIGADVRAHVGEYASHLIAHEFFHTWAATTVDLPDELRWVNEGITDYYAHVVSARVGLKSWDAVAAAIGEKLAKLERNPRRTGEAGEPLTSAGGPLFFSDRLAYELVYDGGLVIGAWLDRLLRSQCETTLDELMRAFMNDARWQTGERPTLDDFLVLVASAANEDIAAELRRLVTEPFEIDAERWFARVGVDVERFEHQPGLSLRANFEGLVVTAIDPAGLAFRLGVQTGDEFVEVNGVPVATEGELRRAWQAPRDGRVQARLERAGEIVTIDAALEPEVGYRVAAAPWIADD